jgi:hypothetical protein
MQDITLGQISGALIFCIGLIGAVITMVHYFKKILDNTFKPTNDKIDNLEKNLANKIDKVDKNATMNYIVRCFNDIDRGIVLDSASKMRLKDQYEHYIKDLNGNTYIHDEYERLKREGKL